MPLSLSSGESGPTPGVWRCLKFQCYKKNTIMDKSQIATENEILRGVVGSVALGLNLPGTDDRDEMAVFIEPMRYGLGFGEFDHLITRDQPEGVRSQPGDLDSTAYSLTKYLKLALSGNPSVLMLLYLPEYINQEPDGVTLVELRDSIVSQKALPRFLGYLTQQKLRLQGELGQKNVHRPELVEKYGYDTKYAMHALRLGYQGIELATTGMLTLPLPSDVRSLLLGVRQGLVDLPYVLYAIQQQEVALREETDDGGRVLRPQPDYDKVYAWACDTYLHWWKREQRKRNL